MDEGWNGTDLARHGLVFCALPDGHTVVGLHFCTALKMRVYPASIQGLHYQLPNDLYNNFTRRIVSAGGERILQAPAATDGVIDLHSRWAAIDGKLGLLGLYGADSLTIERRTTRRGGAFESLFLESFGFPGDFDPRPRWPGEILLDAGWAMVSSVDESAMRQFANVNSAALLPGRPEGIRAVAVTGIDGIRYELAVSLTGNAGELPRGTGEVLATAGGARLSCLGPHA
jgi:hypothetical protein